MEAVISESLFEKQKSSFDMLKRNLVFILLFSAITVSLLKYSFSLPPENKNNRVYPMSHKFRRDVPRTSYLGRKVMLA